MAAGRQREVVLPGLVAQRVVPAEQVGCELGEVRRDAPRERHARGAGRLAVGQPLAKPVVPRGRQVPDVVAVPHDERDVRRARIVGNRLGRALRDDVRFGNRSRARGEVGEIPRLAGDGAHVAGVQAARLRLVQVAAFDVPRAVVPVHAQRRRPLAGVDDAAEHLVLGVPVDAAVVQVNDEQLLREHEVHQRRLHVRRDRGFDGSGAGCS